MTSVLQDYARLRSIRDVTRADAFAIALYPTKNNTDEIGYFRVVVLSSRVAAYCTDDLGLAWDDCITTSDPSIDEYWSPGPHGFEDAGGSGDSILIGVDFNHPLITPFLMQAWPYLHLTTVRRGIIEVFRVSKAVNVAPPLGMPSPTASLTPSITPSPTNTFTPTFTPSPTPTDTLTPSPTYTPSLMPSFTTTSSPTTTLTPSMTLTPSITPSITLTPSITHTPSRTPTRTATLVPDCGNITFTLGIYPGRTDRLRGVITNNNSVTAGFGTVVVTWDSSTGNSNRYVDWIQIDGYTVYGGNDWSSTTSDTTSPVRNLSGGGATHNLDIDYAPDSRGISGTFTVNVSLTVGSLTCPYSDTYTRVGPTATNTRTPTNTLTPSRTSPPTSTPTITRTPTNSLTPSRTPTSTITLTPSLTPTATRTFTPSMTPSRTATRTSTATSTITNTALPPTYTFTPTNTATATRTATRTNTPTATNTFTPFPTNTPTATRTPTPTRTPIGGGEG